MSGEGVKWRKAGAKEALPEGLIQEMDLEGKRLCLLRRDGKVFAFSTICPHAGGRLCEGLVDARGHIICPVHHYRFNPSNGYNSSGEGYKLKTFPLREENGQIFVWC